MEIKATGNKWPLCIDMSHLNVSIRLNSLEFGLFGWQARLRQCPHDQQYLVRVVPTQSLLLRGSGLIGVRVRADFFI